jgi:hypothetical protein
MPYGTALPRPRASGIAFPPEAYTSRPSPDLGLFLDFGGGENGVSETADRRSFWMDVCSRRA